MNEEKLKSKAELRRSLWRIVFEAETKLGKWFDIILLWLIFLSVLAIMLETVKPIEAQYGGLLNVIEWFFTVTFTIEYVLRLWLSRRPLKYAMSFFGIIDLLSCLPSYLALFFANTSGFAVIRILRLLRIFRILKMVHHIRGASVILNGLRKSKAKITVFFFAVLVFAVIAGTLMYFIEGEQPDTQFTSIPMSVYYAIVSVTTVGFGDVTPSTDIGRFFTTLMILGGYAIIAVPTGIVSSAMIHAENKPDETSDACPGCGVHGHLADANYCRKCGEKLD